MTPLLTALALSMAATWVSSQSPSAPLAPSEPAVPAFTALSLQLEPGERHALALHLARQGKLERALEELEGAQGDAEVELDRARVRGLLDLRSAWLAALSSSGKKIGFERSGERFVAAVDRVEGSLVYFRPNPKKIESLPLDALTPAFVAAEADREEERGAAPEWARGFGFALAGDPRAEKLLRGTPETQALAEDCGTRYPALFRAGEATAALIEIAGFDEPRTPAEATAALDAVIALRAHADAPIVQRHRPALESLATALAWRAYTPASASHLFSVPVEELGGDAMRFVYEFDAPAEVADFRPETQFMRYWRKKLREDDPSIQVGEWTISDGAFHGTGAAAYRHCLEFAAPMTVRMRVQARRGAYPSNVNPYFLGLCVEGDWDYVACDPTGGLSIHNAEPAHEESRGGTEPLLADTSYLFEVRHDGATISTWLDGEKLTELPCGGRTKGAVMLWFHTGFEVWIERLEIEGHVDSAALRTMWVEQELAEAGLR